MTSSRSSSDRGKGKRGVRETLPGLSREQSEHRRRIVSGLRKGFDERFASSSYYGDDDDQTESTAVSYGNLSEAEEAARRAAKQPWSKTPVPYYSYLPSSEFAGGSLSRSTSPESDTGGSSRDTRARETTAAAKTPSAHTRRPKPSPLANVVSQKHTRRGTALRPPPPVTPSNSAPEVRPSSSRPKGSDTRSSFYRSAKGYYGEEQFSPSEAESPEREIIDTDWGGTQFSFKYGQGGRELWKRQPDATGRGWIEGPAVDRVYDPNDQKVVVSHSTPSYARSEDSSALRNLQSGMSGLHIPTQDTRPYADDHSAPPGYQAVRPANHTSGRLSDRDRRNKSDQVRAAGLPSYYDVSKRDDTRDRRGRP